MDNANILRETAALLGELDISVASSEHVSPQVDTVLIQENDDQSDEMHDDEEQDMNSMLEEAARLIGDDPDIASITKEKQEASPKQSNVALKIQENKQEELETNASGTKPVEECCTPTSIQEQLKKVATSFMVHDALFVCNGKGICLRDILLLDSALRVPVRLDWSNEHLLMACSHVLENFGYTINYCENSELRASRSKDVEPVAQSEQMTNANNIQEAVSNSLQKFQMFVKRNNPTNKNPTQNQDVSKTYVFVHILLGVDACSKERVLLFAGLSGGPTDLVQELVAYDVICAPKKRGLKADLLDEGYVIDLHAAFSLAADDHLIKFVRPLEQHIREQESAAVQLYSIMKPQYKECGIPSPPFQRPPALNQIEMPVVEVDGEGFDLLETQEFESRELADDALKDFLTKEWNQRVKARKQRKLEHTDIRIDICKRNRKNVLLGLCNNEAAKASLSNMDFAQKMGLENTIVLGAVQCIFERKPGRLHISYDMLMFYSNLLGFVKIFKVPLTDLCNFEKRTLTGAKSLLGDSVILAKYSADKSKGIEFIVPHEADCDKAYELIMEIEKLRNFRDTQEPEAISETTSHSSEDSYIINQTKADILSNHPAPNKAMMESTLLRDDEETF